MTMITPALRNIQILLAAVILLPLFCSAAAVDNAALKYLSLDEASSATITNFTSAGITYYMVFQNQTELFLLKTDGNDYSIVSDTAALTNPLKDYLAFKYGAAVSTEKIVSIKNETLWLTNLSRTCTKKMTDLMLNSPLMNIISNNDYTGNTYRAVTRLTGINGSKGISIPGISNVTMIQNKSGIHKSISKGYLAVIVGGVNYLGEMAGNLSEDASIADNTAIIVQMKAFVAEYKTPLAQYVTDHNFMNTNYKGVMLGPCNFTASSFSRMDSLLVVNALPSESGLADNLSRSATTRISMASASGVISDIVTAEQADMALLNTDAAAARLTLVRYGIPTAGLDLKVASANASLARTRKSLSKAEADTLDADFQAKLAAASNLTALIKLESTVAALTAADAALNASQSAIALASTTGGDNTNVNNLNQTWESTRVSITNAKAQLSQGNPAAVQAITNATATLTQLKATAESGGTSGGLDVLIVVFVVLIIIIGIVVFFYTKNRKKEPPVVISAGPGTPGLRKASSGIIIERK